MENLQERYDSVVIGDHPAALLSAFRLIKSGFSVLMIPGKRFPTLRAHSSGAWIDLESNFLLGVNPAEGKKGWWNHLLGDPVTPALQKILQNLVCQGTQILTQEFRVLVGDSRHSLDNELLREFHPASVDEIGLIPALEAMEPFLLRLVAQYAQHPRLNVQKKPLWNEFVGALEKEHQALFKASPTNQKWRSLAALQVIHEKNPSILELFRAVCFANLKNQSHFSTGIEWLRAFQMGSSSGAFRGGLTQFRRSLLNLLESEGAHLLRDSVCSQLLVNRGRLLGVQIEGESKVISARTGILGASLRDLLFKLSVLDRKKIERQQKKVYPIGWKFTLALSVSPEAIPSPLNPRAIWYQEGAPLLEMEVVHPQDYSQQPSSFHTIFLRTVVPFREETLQVDYQRSLADRMFRKWTEILPFGENHVLQVYPNFRGGEGPGMRTPFGIFNSQVKYSEQGQLALSPLYGFSSLAEIPTELRVLGGDGIHLKTGVENLFAVSDESYPSVGHLGPLFAGLEASQAVAHTLTGQSQSGFSRV